MKNEKPPEFKRRWGLFPHTLASDIERLVKPVYKQHGFSEHRVLTQWADIVGRELAAGSTPKKLSFPKGKRENGVLHVTVNSGARALELQHMQPVILERIDTYFGYKAIEKILFLQDSSSHTVVKPARKLRVQKKTDQRVVEMVTTCEDEQLRAALLSLGSHLTLKE